MTTPRKPPVIWYPELVINNTHLGVVISSFAKWSHIDSVNASRDRNWLTLAVVNRIEEAGYYSQKPATGQA